MVGKFIAQNNIKKSETNATPYVLCELSWGEKPTIFRLSPKVRERVFEGLDQVQRLGFWRRPRGLWQWKKNSPRPPSTSPPNFLLIIVSFHAAARSYSRFLPQPTTTPACPTPALSSPVATSYTFSDYFQSQSNGFFLSNPVISGPSVEEDEGEKSLWLWFRQGL